jgi:hypothetical protein
MPACTVICRPPETYSFTNLSNTGKPHNITSKSKEHAFLPRAGAAGKVFFGKNYGPGERHPPKNAPWKNPAAIRAPDEPGVW